MGSPALKDSAPTEIVARLNDLERRAGHLLRPIGVAPLPFGPVLLPGGQGAPFDWVMMRLLDDPLFQAGELQVPVDARRQLRRVERAGVVFDDLLIGHEVPPKSFGAKIDPARLLETLRTTPAPTPDVPAGVRALKLGLRASKALGSAAAMAVAAPLGALADPVLLGAITATGNTEPGTPAALFLITRW